MFGATVRSRCEIRDRTVYMEVYGDNKVSYRVTAARILKNGRQAVTYGIEVEDQKAGDKEEIPDFSPDIEDAVDFAEMLISQKIRPNRLYSKALGYLCISI